MIEEPYRWVEAIANRREYIETQLQVPPAADADVSEGDAGAEVERRPQLTRHVEARVFATIAQLGISYHVAFSKPVGVCARERPTDKSLR